MDIAHSRERDVFVDVIEKLPLLTSSQLRFIKEMLARPATASAISKKKLIGKSHGIWADRNDIGESVEYVNRIREGWNARSGGDRM